MNELIGKLTNLTYEFFGVILPGLVATLFLASWWVALGPQAPLVTFGNLPQLKFGGILQFLRAELDLGTAIPLLALSYFLGHLVLWIARSGLPDSQTPRSFDLVWRCLKLKIPKPSAPYYESLEPLYKRVAAQFTEEGAQLEWRQFYPVAKSYIAQRLRYSLVATYQNKYTLHRSFVIIAAMLFWGALLTLFVGAIVFLCVGIAPRWVMLATLVGGALCLVWGFANSYLYHWQMFGNTIITESYSLTFGPVIEPSDHKKSVDS